MRLHYIARKVKEQDSAPERMIREYFSPIPGDPDWCDAPYEVIEELRLHKLKHPIRDRDD